MNKHNDVVTIHKERSTLVRCKFGPGMLLHHEDLDQMTTYTQELSRLMFRSLFGCGVICGLVVKLDTKCGKVYVTVCAGLALDCSGDPVYVPKDQSIVLDDQCDPNIPSPLWVVLCGTVTCCAPRTATCSSDDDEAPSVCTRERDGYEIRVVSKRPECVCGCPELDDQCKPYERDFETTCKCVDPELPCYKDHYAGKCGCSCDKCSDCNCTCILLARLDKSDADGSTWTPDHSVRRFIRPVLMRDPQVEREKHWKKMQEEKEAGGPAAQAESESVPKKAKGSKKSGA